MSEQNPNRSFYQDRYFNMQVLGGLSALFMLGLSIYLTKHYFNVIYPSGKLGGSALCDINAFFNCDVATTSLASNIFGVPISLIGVLLGIFILLGFFFKSEGLERTIHSLLYINAAGCIILFIYSLVGLGGLCPACTLYYIFSLITLFVFRKTSDFKGVHLPSFFTFGLVYIAIFGITKANLPKTQNDASDVPQSVREGLIKQFKELKKMGTPDFDSEYIMSSSSVKFKEAPVQITKFSDFECPACKMLSEVLHKISNKYKEKVAIQYFFYPLDNNCNPEMTRPMHKLACKAAYIAACKPEKFSLLEQEFFSNQEKLTEEWLNNIAKRENIEECSKDLKTKEKVISYIKAAKPFNVKSTPTFLLNGVKIEGVLPQSQLEVLINYILKQKK